ncbi:hypothetical protein GCM10023336_70610 [Streptomyces similanensis]|uniref:Uncharacterized protein n=1 Tax=Streptomyces similanensis TaxID=1274988 RepID=A0ABP9LMW9_9ACTN
MWLRRMLRLVPQEPKRRPAAPLDPAMVATTTYTVTVTPTRDGWSIRMGGGTFLTCRHLGEVEDIARERIVFSTGMPPERVLIEVKRA